METKHANKYQEMQDSSRVWIYQSIREFNEIETISLKNDLAQFAQSWVSHNQLLTAVGDVLYNRFIVLMVDESYVGAGGCSIDSSVYFLKQIEFRYRTELFERLNFAWLEDEVVRTASKDEFRKLFEKGLISDETPVFDNLVSTKEEFESEWIKPLAKSWHKKVM